MLAVGTSVESPSDVDADAGAAAGLVGGAGAAVATVATRLVGETGDDATSPALAFRPTLTGFFTAAVRRSGVGLRATADPLRSSEDFRTHPSRETLAQPVGAEPDASDTAVPASSDARPRPELAARDRTTADRLPTRGDAFPRCADSRARSTKPSIVTFAYAPRSSVTRSDEPG
jgi:hypothetical protein